MIMPKPKPRLDAQAGVASPLGVAISAGDRETLSMVRQAIDTKRLRLADDGTTHASVNIIPHTAQHSTLGDVAPGRQLNVEIDVLARYIDRMLAARSQR